MAAGVAAVDGGVEMKHVLSGIGLLGGRTILEQRPNCRVLTGPAATSL